MLQRPKEFTTPRFFWPTDLDQREARIRSKERAGGADQNKSERLKEEASPAALPDLLMGPGFSRSSSETLRCFSRGGF